MVRSPGCVSAEIHHHPPSPTAQVVLTNSNCKVFAWYPLVYHSGGLKKCIKCAAPGPVGPRRWRDFSRHSGPFPRRTTGFSSICSPGGRAGLAARSRWLYTSERCSRTPSMVPVPTPALSSYTGNQDLLWPFTSERWKTWGSKFGTANPSTCKRGSRDLCPHAEAHAVY